MRIPGSERDAENEHFLFEYAFVADTGRGPVAFPYDDLRIYRVHEANLSRQHDLVTTWRFERGDGCEWQTTQRNKEALARVYERVLATACARQRPGAVQRLAEGGSLVFGHVELDLSRVTIVGGSAANETVPWTQVSRLTVYKGTTMKIELIPDASSGKKRSTVATISDLPNFPLLWEMAHVAHATAQG